MATQDEDGFREAVGEDLWRENYERALREQRTVRRRRRLAQVTRSLPTVAVCGVLAGLTAWYLHGGSLGHVKLTAPDAAVSPRPADPPQSLVTDADLRSDPYRGTPAAKFPTRITVPAPAPIGRHGRDEVAAALAKTAHLLTVGRLDKTLLTRRDGGPYASGLALNYRLFVYAQTQKTHDAPDGLSTLAPGQVLLAAPRVSGTMRPALGPKGELTVVTNYVFVYALVPSRPVLSREEALLSVRSDATYTFYGDRYAPGDRGAWLTAGRFYSWNVSCAPSNRGLLALPAADDIGSGHAASARERAAAFDPSAPAPTRDDCSNPSHN
ncbi:MAG: hypothetical protein QOI35_1801 [Cryptosporangiaceae bacterium]|nr:hypothetical protein [Cryptosporangiaceae bacterium]